MSFITDDSPLYDAPVLTGRDAYPYNVSNYQTWAPPFDPSTSEPIDRTAGTNTSAAVVNSGMAVPHEHTLRTTGTPAADMRDANSQTSSGRTLHSKTLLWVDPDLGGMATHTIRNTNGQQPLPAFQPSIDPRGGVNDTMPSFTMDENYRIHSVDSNITDAYSGHSPRYPVIHGLRTNAFPLNRTTQASYTCQQLPYNHNSTSEFVLNQSARGGHGHRNPHNRIDHAPGEYGLMPNPTDCFRETYTNNAITATAQRRPPNDAMYLYGASRGALPMPAQNIHLQAPIPQQQGYDLYMDQTRPQYINCANVPHGNTSAEPYTDISGDGLGLQGVTGDGDAGYSMVNAFVDGSSHTSNSSDLTTSADPSTNYVNEQDDALTSREGAVTTGAGMSPPPANGNNPSGDTASSTEDTDGEKRITLIYQDFESVKKHFQTALFEYPKPDPSIPRTPDEKQDLVKRLLLAIYQNIETIESHENPVFLKRWKNGAGYFKPDQLERMVWRLLEMIINLHEEGWKFPVDDKLTIEYILETKDFTFEVRFRCIETFLTYSKRGCEDLVKGEKYYTVVGMAKVLRKRTIQNRDSNRKKAGRLALVKNSESKEKEEKPRKATKSKKEKPSKQQKGDEQRAPDPSSLVGFAVGEYVREGRQQLPRAVASASSTTTTGAPLPAIQPTMAIQVAKEDTTTLSLPPLGLAELNAGENATIHYNGVPTGSLSTLNVPQHLTLSDYNSSRKRARDQEEDGDQPDVGARPFREVAALTTRPSKRTRSAPNGAMLLH